MLAATSASYVAGFNNRVAAIGAAATGIAVLLWTWRFGDAEFPGDTYAREDEAKLGPLRIGCFVVGTCLFCLIAEKLLASSNLRYLADAGYFVEQISAHADYGRQLYRELEFAYGPLLFYPTGWIEHGLHCSWLGAYFGTLALEQSLGLLELAFLFKSLPVSREGCRFALPLFALGALNPLLGLNYTLFRYLTPFFCLVFAKRLQRNPWCAVSLFVSSAVCFGISAEIGVSFSAGALVLVAWRSWRNGSAVWMGFAPLAGGIAFFLSFGGGYLRMLRSFSKGALNLPVAPYPHIMIFLFAIVWLVPRAVGSTLRLKADEGDAILACYTASLALLPAALGRCDPLHVFFNGAGIVVLSLVAMAWYNPAARIAWAVALVTLVGWEQGVTNRIFRYRTADTLGVAVIPHLSPRLKSVVAQAVGPGTTAADLLDVDDDAAFIKGSAGLNVQQLEHYVGRAPVDTPIEVAPEIEQALKRSRHYQPGYYAFMVDVFSAANEQREIESLNRAQWALLPLQFQRPFIETPADLTDIQGFTFPYNQRNPVPFHPGEAFANNLEQQWEGVSAIGDFMLWRKK